MLKRTGEIDEKIDTFDFIFSSLHFIREEDAVKFIRVRVLKDENLTNIFLNKIVRHSHTCLKIIEDSEKSLSWTDFYFSHDFFDLMTE